MYVDRDCGILNIYACFLGGTLTLGQLTKAALICGSGSMIILVSILINLPFYLQILLLLAGLAVSVYGVLLLVKMVANPVDKTPTAQTEQRSKKAPQKKKRPTSTF